MRKPPYSAAVVGLGSIGSELDYDSSADIVLTHSKAFHLHPSFELVAAVDLNVEKRKRFEKKYEVESFSSTEEMFKKKRPQIVALAVPTSEHFSEFGKILKEKPEVIICEKPLADHFEKALEMCEKSEKAKVDLIVNYIRRYEPGVLKIRNILREKKLGPLQKVIVTYSKGVANNASHFVDLLRFLLGEVRSIEVMGSGRSARDPDIDFKLELGEELTPVFFISAKEISYSLRDIEIFGDNASISYKYGGLEIVERQPEKSKIFSGYSFLSHSGQAITSSLQKSQWHVVDRLAECLEKNIPMPTQARDSLESLRVVEKVKALWNR